VLLNNTPVTLPALRAVCNADSLHVSDEQGTLDVILGTPCEYFVLDDPSDPLVLTRRVMALGYIHDRKTGHATRRVRNGAWQLDTEEIRVVMIGSASAGEGPDSASMENALAAHKKVVIYGIYFDFAKADIKKESDPVLREIANLLHKNPAWTLAINGYTDSIGGDAYNLDLSRRRAAAVKDTLVTGYHISANRLTTAGYGSADPVDSNATLEGRARNRRVELVRQ
jgi:outer membrane protein OmpA-like peptidoglycan-associated protein